MFSTGSARRRLVGLFLSGLVLVSMAIYAAEPSLTLNAKNADLRDVLNTLAAQAGVNISMDETVSGNVSIHMENTSLEEALARLAEIFHFYVTRNGQFYTVTRQLIKVTKEADGSFSADIRAAKLISVLTALTGASGVNLTFVGASPPDNVNMTLTKVSLADLIAFLATSTGCEVSKEGAIHIFRAASKTAGTLKVQYEQGRLSVDIAGAQLSAVVKELSLKTGQAVICDQTAATTQINIYFALIPLDDGLTALANANGLRVYKETSDYRFARGTDSGTTSVIKARDGRLTLDVRNQELVDTLSEIGRQSRITILPEQGVSGRVSGSVNDEPFDRGLSLFLEANGFVAERDGAVYRVQRMSSGPSIIISTNQDGTLDLDVTNANLTAALTELATKKDLDIVIYANVNWNVMSVHLNHVPFEDALDRLLAGSNFSYRLEGRTYLIGDGITLRQGEMDFVQSEIIPLRYLLADNLLSLMPANFPRQNFIVLKESNSLLLTASPKMIAAFKQFAAKVDVPQEALRSETLTLKHMKAEDAMRLLPQSLSKSVELALLKDSNSLILTGTENNRELVRGFLDKIDVSAPMILFDTLVLQLNRTDASSGGLGSLSLTLSTGQKIGWDSTSGLVGTIFSPGTPATAALTASINAAISQGEAKVRANPKIVTLSGTPARFNVVTKYTYMVTTSTTGSTGQAVETKTPQSLDSGITLNITPWVSGSKEINLDLEPSIKQFTSTPEGSTLPGVLERSTKSTVRIMDGYTVVISGFVQEFEDVTTSKIPILGSIPILGRLFSSTKKNLRQDEFVIIITPRLIEDPAQINELMAQITGEGAKSEPIVIDLDE